MLWQVCGGFKYLRKFDIIHRDLKPSNILIHKDSGKVVHIDFGDCFEVAVLRDKFP